MDDNSKLVDDAPAVRVSNERKASELLANERTFLAWIRTSIAVISLGFVIAKFSIWFNQFEKTTGIKAEAIHSGLSIPIGVIMMGFGGALAFMAFARYRIISRQIEHGEVYADQGLVLLVTLFVVFLAIMVIIYIVITAGWA